MRPFLHSYTHKLFVLLLLSGVHLSRNTPYIHWWSGTRRAAPHPSTFRPEPHSIISYI
ncbi:hypothetical protein LINPERHAP1_LOCUS14400, partial [Linum perenne]